MKNIFLILAVIFTSSQTIMATTIKVINTNDSGSGSLREAITLANATPGKDTISFNIPGVAPHTIALTSGLPAITSTMIIDGTSQPPNGFAGVSPKIILDGSATNSVAGLTFQASFSELYGLFITNFKFEGVHVLGEEVKIGAPEKGNVLSGNEYDQLFIENVMSGSIQSNKIGTDTLGIIREDLSGEGYNGIDITNSSNVLIGGDTEIEGNLISGNEYNGVYLACTKNVSIFNNKIGSDLSGTKVLSNRYHGIHLERCYDFITSNSTPSENNIIGEIGKGNLISGNEYNGINLECASSNLIYNNLVGTDITGLLPMPNEYFGIGITYDSYQTLSICSGDNNVIGNLNKENVVSGNLYGGIFISCSSYNVIAKNYIGTDITGIAPLPNEYVGITIEQDLVFPGHPECITKYNQVGIADQGNTIHYNKGYGVSVVGGNTLHNKISQNSFSCNQITSINLQDLYSYGHGPGNNDHPAPVITSATNSWISGVATANDTIEVYQDDNCNACEGETYLGYTVADGQGNWDFMGSFTGKVTAIASDPTGNSSKFSNCPLVTTTSNKNITDLTEQPIAVYPNPVLKGNNVTISVDQSENFKHSTLGISLFDSKGSQISQPYLEQSATIELSTEGLQAGLYFITISTQDGQVESKKLIIY